MMMKAPSLSLSSRCFGRIGVAMFLLAGACGGAAVGDDLDDLDDATLSAASTLDHPDFLRKLRDPDAYVVDRQRTSLESLCGKSDLQHVNSYNGSLGVSKAYVAGHKNPVGALTSSPTAGKYCSGTLVGSNLFLTAGHCVDSSTVGDYVSFNYERAAGSTSLLTQEFVKVTAIVENGGTLDYAVLRLAGTPGAKYGFTKIQGKDPAASAALAIIQHPNGKAKQIEAGKVAGLSGSYVTYGDLDTLPGSSGSGVLNAAGELVGVHTLGGCTSSGGKNSGVRMSKIVQKSAVLR